MNINESVCNNRVRFKLEHLVVAVNKPVWGRPINYVKKDVKSRRFDPEKHIIFSRSVHMFWPFSEYYTSFPICKISIFAKQLKIYQVPC